jgi:hypothetical protein
VVGGGGRNSGIAARRVGIADPPRQLARRSIRNGCAKKSRQGIRPQLSADRCAPLPDAGQENVNLNEIAAPQAGMPISEAFITGG